MKAEIQEQSWWIPLPEYFAEDNRGLRHFFGNLLDLADFIILDVVSHEFEPEGFTALWLLGESHFSIHTFPEEEKFYIQISSCNERKFREFCALVEVEMTFLSEDLHGQETRRLREE